MRFVLLLPGKLRGAPIRALLDEYAKRCRPFGAQIEFDTVRQQPDRSGSEREVAEALDREAEALLARVPKGARVVALDERGELATSRGLAARIGEWRDAGAPALAFFIGSARGLAPRALAAADWRLSLSRLTLPHELVVPVLAEQLYRSLTILAGHPYHRD